MEGTICAGMTLFHGTSPIYHDIIDVALRAPWVTQVVVVNLS
jgi:hypothetical protein